MATRLKDEYLTIPEAAEELGVAASTVRRWIREERLPAYRLGDRRILVKRDDLSSLVTPVHSSALVIEDITDPADLERLRTRRLTPEEKERGFAAIAELERLGREMAERRNGKPYVSAVQLLHEERDARARRILGS